MHPSAERGALCQARRLVVKVGTRVLVRRNGRPDRARFAALTRQLAALRAQGMEVVLVSSGAIAAGMAALAMRCRPTGIPELQMAAAVGQVHLMALYEELFRRRGQRVGQVLLTHDDLRNRVRHLNARNTMLTMLARGIVPVVNENDVVAVEEIRFGDNDQLASLVALLVEADAMILLTTVDGLREPWGAAGRTRRVPVLQGVTGEALGLASGKGGELSTGGMASKLQSAGVVAASGIPVLIADGRRRDVLLRIVRGHDEGTLVLPSAADGERWLSHRKRWIAYFHKTAGALVVDQGAMEAIRRHGRSLLAIGIRSVEGEFGRGAVVEIRGPDGAAFARGLASYTAAEIRRIRGMKTAEIGATLGSLEREEVVHRDNLALLTAGPERER